MEAPTISTLDDEDSPPPIFRTMTPSGTSVPKIKVKLRVPSAMTASSKPSDDGESDEEMVDELADDDDAASSAQGGTGAVPPLQAPPKSSSTRGGKGSRGPRKKRMAQIGERVMSPPPRQIGTEWVVHVSQGQTVPPSDDARSDSTAPPARGRGRGSRGGKRGVPGPGRGWRKGITNAKKAAWEAEHAAQNNSDSTPTAFPLTMPSGSGSGSGMFREYHPPSSDITPPAIPAPPLLQIKQQQDRQERPSKLASSAAVLSVQRPQNAQYPPPIVQPTLPSQEIRYLPPEPRLEPGMAAVDSRGGLIMPAHGIPSRPFPVQAPLKPGNQPPPAPPQPIDKAGKKFMVRKWQNVRKEIKGIGGSRWFVRSWIGDKDSDYARHRAMSAPTLSLMPTFPARFKFKQEFNGSTGTGTPADRDTPMEGTAQNPVIVDLTDDVDMDSPAPQPPEGAIVIPP
ncbi:hypothetical protein CALVIDRAFT_600320 [Calocera viscosa TUFC12733]|uniref:Uncharacterized protein n=1 Tax=Calocera viscosa (strain TUFC12733) TaxID=1330018 RepID=A0A167K001_CALVF|nr:hypothetical protein CALVIDRAFT_600320 [Calocera viscosa TUFC12733]